MNNIKHFTVSINGLTPLVMNCDTTCNPLHPLTKKIKAITSERKKTEALYEQLFELEFESRIYYDSEIGVYMPSKCLKGCIWAAAKQYKKGKLTKGIIIEDEKGYPLLPYTGKTPKDLYNIMNKEGERIYSFQENLSVQNTRITRVRPKFSNWQVKFALFLDTEILQVDDLKLILNTAGMYYGIGDLRPQLATGSCGKFEVTEFKESK